jgi:8-oxo-dGTP pyrophosphatase MutT (NUDIX family)
MSELQAIPKPAATILLLRDGTNGLEVLVLEKAAGEHFAGGALVFPGGKVETEDESYDGALGEPRHSLSTLKIAAVREMFEECGIMLARHPGAERLMDAAEVAQCLAADPKAKFLDLAKAIPFDLAADQMARFAHWITPPSRSTRFDTHFFVAAAPEGQMTARVDGHEIIDANWRRPAEILEDAAAGSVKLVLPTMMNLDKLSKRGSVAEALALARTDKVVCVMPRRVDTPDGPQVYIPAEAGYGVTTISADLVRRA